jgi:hypothetical protein
MNTNTLFCRISLNSCLNKNCFKKNVLEKIKYMLHIKKVFLLEIVPVMR